MNKAVALLPSLVILIILGCVPANSFGQTLRIPVRLELEADRREVEAGSKLTLRVSLRNFRNEIIPALRDTPITVSSKTLAGKEEFVIPRGQSFVRVDLVASKAGLAKVDAAAKNLAPAALLVVIRPAQKVATSLQGASAPRAERKAVEVSRVPAAAPVETRPSVTSNVARRAGRVRLREPASAGSSAEVAQPRPSPPVLPAPPRSEVATRASAPSAAEAPLPGAGSPSASATTRPLVAALPPPSRIDVEINPSQVYPQGDTWITDVTVVALTSNHDLATASEDIPVRLQAALGTFSTTQATIPQGSASTAAQSIILTSRRSGSDLIQATSGVGSAEKQVMYYMQLPSHLRLEANPPSVVNDGRSSVDVTVFLLGPDNRLTSYSDREAQVLLSSSLGNLDPRIISIRRRSYWGEAKLTSTVHGVATLQAKAPEVVNAEPVSVRFLFPWQMIILATVGGMLGGVIRTAKGSFSRKWWDHFWRNTVVAAMLGLVFYILAFFGAIATIPKAELPFVIASIPTVNELGAIVLGFAGGFYGRLIWKT